MYICEQIIQKHEYLQKISMKVLSKKSYFLAIVSLCFFHFTLFSQKNNYLPNQVDSLYNYLDNTTEYQINHLDKSFFSKKKDIYKKRLKNLKEQIEDSTFLFNPKITSRLNQVLNNIYKANPKLKQYHFYFFIDTSVYPNAASFGDGTFIVNIGLFDFLNSDDELAFILCHEIAHFLNDDFNSQLNRYISKLYSKETKTRIKEIKRQQYGQTNAGLQLLKEINYDLYSYSKKKEVHADLIGFELFHNTQYNPNASITTLEKLGKLEELVFNDSISLKSAFDTTNYHFKSYWIEEEDKLFDSEEEIDDYELDKDSLRSHPHAKERIKELLAKYKIDTLNNRLDKRTIVNLQSLSKPSIVRILIDKKKYDYLLYYLLRNSPPDYETLSLALELIYNSKRNHSIGKSVGRDTPFSNEKYLKQIRLFIHNTDLRDIKNILKNYTLQYKDKITDKTFNRINNYFKP